jgi:hypothetical protein
VCVCVSTSILNQQTKFRKFLYEQYAAEDHTYTAYFKRFRLVAKSLLSLHDARQSVCHKSTAV